MLSFLIFRPASTAVLVFLHGVGEAFVNTKTESVGFKNLFRQGVPKALHDPAVLPADHPLRADAVAVVAPLLMHRETEWTQAGNADQILQALNTIASEAERRVYVMGFSKGGQAAFRLAGDLKPRAIVTIDASPMLELPDEVAREISRCDIPFWSIHTNYPDGYKFKRIEDMHNCMTVDNFPEHWNAIAAPNKGARCKSLVALDHVPLDDRHVALCSIVTTATVPYEWLMKH